MLEISSLCTTVAFWQVTGSISVSHYFCSFLGPFHVPPALLSWCVVLCWCEDTWRPSSLGCHTNFVACSSAQFLVSHYKVSAFCHSRAACLWRTLRPGSERRVLQSSFSTLSFRTTRFFTRCPEIHDLRSGFSRASLRAVATKEEDDACFEFESFQCRKFSGTLMRTVDAACFECDLVRVFFSVG